MVQPCSKTAEWPHSKAGLKGLLSWRMPWWNTYEDNGAHFWTGSPLKGKNQHGSTQGWSVNQSTTLIQAGEFQQLLDRLPNWRDIHGAQRMNPTDFDDPGTFPLAQSAGQTTRWIAIKWFPYNVLEWLWTSSWLFLQCHQDIDTL